MKRGLMALAALALLVSTASAQSAKGQTVPQPRMRTVQTDTTTVYDVTTTNKKGTTQYGMVEQTRSTPQGGTRVISQTQYSDYTPRVWALAVPRNISRSRLTGTGIPMKLHYDSYYGLGTAEGDFNGITLSVYDRERTICDCIRHRDEIDSEMFVKAVWTYAADRNKDLRRLSDYAVKLGISEKVRKTLVIVLNA